MSTVTTNAFEAVEIVYATLIKFHHMRGSLIEHYHFSVYGRDDSYSAQIQTHVSHNLTGKKIRPNEHNKFVDKCAHLFDWIYMMLAWEKVKQNNTSNLLSDVCAKLWHQNKADTEAKMKVINLTAICVKKKSCWLIVSTVNRSECRCFAIRTFRRCFRLLEMRLSRRVLKVHLQPTQSTVAWAVGYFCGYKYTQLRHGQWMAWIWVRVNV